MTSTNTRFDVSGFSKDARAMIARLEEAGVTFRLSSKNHAIGVAPDGAGTISIPRKFTGRGRANCEASVERLLTKIGYEPPVKAAMPAPKPAPKAPAVATLASVKPWLAHKNPGKDGGMYYESQTTNERRWSDGTVDYICSYCGKYDSPNPRSVASHYARSKDHPDLGQGRSDKEVKGTDYTEPLGQRHSPSQARIEAILAILAKHPEANHDLPLDELIALILAADMERDPLYERVAALGFGDGPLTDTQIVAQVRALVGVTERESELEASLAEAQQRITVLSEENTTLTDEVTRLRAERAALADLLKEES